jgi:Holliday junction resolvase RusA-like endonuclease
MILTVPWRYVMHDNHRLMPVKMGKMVRLITAPKYRDAKFAATVELMRQWQRPRLHGFVALTGTVFMPDRRKRDAGNYRKLLTDALSGVAYDDDSQLIREVWELGGVVPKDQARVELIVEAATPIFTTQKELL